VQKKSNKQKKTKISAKKLILIQDLKKSIAGKNKER